MRCKCCNAEATRKWGLDYYCEECHGYINYVINEWDENEDDFVDGGFDDDTNSH